MINREDWTMIQDMRSSGCHIRDISRKLGCPDKTVSRAIGRQGPPPSHNTEFARANSPGGRIPRWQDWCRLFSITTPKRNSDGKRLS